MPFVPANPYETFFSGQNRRSFNGMPDTKQASFGYVFNPFYDNGNGLTGQFQPLTTNNQGALRVDVASGASVNVNGFDVLTGQVAQLQTAVNALTGTITSDWRKVKTVGYATVFGAVTGSSLVNKVQGYTKTITQPSFIQLFDSAAAPVVGANPDFVVTVQTTNNWFIDLAEAGVRFSAGLQIVNSSTPDVYTPLGASDFIASAIVK